MIRLVVVIAALCLAEAAQAQVVWSTPASGCVPDEDTTRQTRHRFDNASVRHANNNVDLIVLTCPIPRFSSMVTIWNHIMEYQDSTGQGTSAFVRTRLFRLPFNSTTPILMATANSNELNATGFNFMASNEFTHPFDFDLATYWIRVDMDRSSTSETVILYSVRLVDND
jgi:hypothetical protein